MTLGVGHDEFEERARLAAEAQKIADEYVGGLRRVAIDAFLIAGACALLAWLGWQLATGSAPEFIERDPIVQELREHSGR